MHPVAAHQPALLDRERNTRDRNGPVRATSYGCSLLIRLWDNSTTNSVVECTSETIQCSWHCGTTSTRHDKGAQKSASTHLLAPKCA